MISCLGALSSHLRCASKATGTGMEMFVTSPSISAWLKVQQQPGSVGSHLTEVPPCSYLDASTFGDHDLPHAVEAVEVWLREAGRQDGTPAFSEVATTWHWEETRAGQRLLGSALWCLGPWASAGPPPGLASAMVFSSTFLRISGLCWAIITCWLLP